jgi:hypothetical protein
MIKEGDLVELLPTDNRNRQLRMQEKKYDWEVLTVGTPQCLSGRLGYFIKHIGSDHTRWVSENDIKIRVFKENRR